MFAPLCCSKIAETRDCCAGTHAELAAHTAAPLASRRRPAPWVWGPLQGLRVARVSDTLLHIIARAGVSTAWL